MKNILIIGTLSRLEPSSQPADELVAFTQAAVTSLEDVAVEHAPLDALVHVLDGADTKIMLAETGQDIATFDFVWLRGRFVSSMNDVAVVAEYLERQGVNYVNRSYANRSTYGKHAQMHLLASLGLPYPKTVFAVSTYAHTAFTTAFDFPFIVKNNHGSHGEKNYLVKDKTELDQILQSNPKVSFVAQEFIVNESDFRVLIVGDGELIIERIGAEGSHLNNTSQGGTAKLVRPEDFPPEVLAQARQFAAALHYEISGIDVLFSSHTRKHYFLEANSQPQLISGAFLADKQRLLASYLVHKLAD